MDEALRSYMDISTKVGDAILQWARPANRGESPLKVRGRAVTDDDQQQQLCDARKALTRDTLYAPPFSPTSRTPSQISAALLRLLVATCSLLFLAR